MRAQYERMAFQFFTIASDALRVVRAPLVDGFQFFTIASVKEASSPTPHRIYTFNSLRLLHLELQSNRRCLRRVFQFFTIASQLVMSLRHQGLQHLSILYDCFREGLASRLEGIRRTFNSLRLLQRQWNCHDHGGTRIRFQFFTIASGYRTRRSRARTASSPAFNSLRLLHRQAQCLLQCR